MMKIKRRRRIRKMLVQVLMSRKRQKEPFKVALLSQ
jgi:hypothetical protein